MERQDLPQAISVKCNAKVNLFLRVTGRRSDGYHDIETIFHSISLADTVTVRRAKQGLSIVSNDPTLPRDGTNLAVRAAARLLGPEAGRGAEIEIDKRIPVGAGLGGGSADAAGVLVGLNLLYGLGHDALYLETLARSIGADVSFMLGGGCAIGRGRGDQLEMLRPLPPLPLVVGMPGITISTTWAYDSLKMGLTRPNGRLTMVADAIRTGDVARLCGFLENDFETLVLERFPVVKRIKDAILACGASGALMSGSGSSVFGIFLKAGDAEASAKVLASQGLTVFLASLAVRGVIRPL